MSQLELDMITRITFVLATGTLLAYAAANVPASTAAPVVPAVREYSEGTALGRGQVRTYVSMDPAGEPAEVGVAFSETALEDLPTAGSGHHGDHSGMTHTFLLELPNEVAPFRFVELNWNPAGHEPEGVYAGAPHFDFHFWTASQALRASIMPDDPEYAAKAERLPAPEFVPEFNAALAPPGAPISSIAVPMMGVHWVDVRSHELQALLGKPEAYAPFTTTFIHGTWDGRLIFWEPMITRAHIEAKKTAIDTTERDEIIPVPAPKAYAEPGYYPAAYRITWDEEAREYRIALTRLQRQG
jgi:hypothetical protein